MISSCRNKENSNKTEAKSVIKPVIQTDYLSLIISFDTLSSARVKKIIYSEESLLSQNPDKESNPYYHYFKAKKYNYAKKRDSAVAEYEKMKGEKPNDEIEFLKTDAILTRKMASGSMVESALMSQIFTALEKAEQVHSRLTYRFYDLVAQAYFQNDNEKKSIEYSAIYFKNHPFKTHPAIKQRYFDISFLLAFRLYDFKKMAFYNTQARKLAQQVGDSMAIARTYDNEAQIYSKQLQTAKALSCSKIYFNYLKKINNLNDIAYNNLATAFYQDHQPDSAIKYFKEGNVLDKLSTPGKQKDIYYNGLRDAYKMKGDYKHALEAADSAYSIELRNYQAIEAVKVAEIHEKYETEKKDRNIAVLNGRNKLNETIIKQQRWTLFLAMFIFLGLVSFFYTFYRQQRLRAKNKLLKSENQRLNVEQKMLQAQLNPHFIFNAIANLQSLIASGYTEKSVCYLRSFSELLRSTLEQNRKDFIEIDEEIASLNNYLRLQQMRYADIFDYKIIVDDELNLNDTLIPPMLVQPFVENAIEHGFRNIAYKGLLAISFKIKDDLLAIEIDDNGSGLGAKPNENPKKQSLAQVILKERIDLLFTANRQQAEFTVKDKGGNRATGVTVKILIPIIND
ncbi:histidine kinase [Pedobacter miscanthi]|uniref:tetratricopeptide repeat-containing sensor histidine kinase n=1 Tax=Pedobacter miscanthi TaxID=2259170 RepID=UPI00292ED767|nr:histidine kinase [Pedobacter miscanthi]